MGAGNSTSEATVWLGLHAEGGGWRAADCKDQPHLAGHTKICRPRGCAFGKEDDAFYDAFHGSLSLCCGLRIEETCLSGYSLGLQRMEFQRLISLEELVVFRA